MSRRRRGSHLLVDDDADPLSVVVNLFDVAMVFAVSLMVAMVMHMNMTEVFGNEDFTVVKNPGKDNMEIITKQGKQINTYKASGETTDNNGAKGKRLGTAYQLENGQIIYVPEQAHCPPSFPVITYGYLNVYQRHGESPKMLHDRVHGCPCCHPAMYGASAEALVLQHTSIPYYHGVGAM